MRELYLVRQKRSIASIIVEIAFYFAPATRDFDVNDDLNKSEILTNFSWQYALAKREKTNDRSEEDCKEKDAILMSIRYILIQYSGAWVINERILLRREN